MQSQTAASVEVSHANRDLGESDDVEMCVDEVGGTMVQTDGQDSGFVGAGFHMLHRSAWRGKITSRYDRRRNSVQCKSAGTGDLGDDDVKCLMFVWFLSSMLHVSSLWLTLKLR